MESVKSGDVEVCSGVLGAVDVEDGGVEGVVRFERHIFLGGTGDGGMGVWVEGPRWRGWPDSEVFEVPEGGGGRGVEGGGEKREKRRLQGYCHCRGVEFYITPPDEQDDNHAEFSSGAEKNVLSSPFSLLWLSLFTHSSFLILLLTYSLTLTPPIFRTLKNGTSAPREPNISPVFAPAIPAA